MKFTITLLAALLFTACSTVTGYKPTVNIKADKNSVAVEEDLDYCKGLAAQTAGWTRETVGDTLAASSYAASIGAVSGAMISGAASAGTAAGIGAAIGGISGLWYGTYEADETFKRAYARCMAQLNHPVLY